MSLLNPDAATVAGWVRTVTDALPAVDIESRLALSLLVTALTQAQLSADVLLREIEATKRRQFVLLGVSK